MRDIKVRAWDEERQQMFTSPKWVEFQVNVDGLLTARNFNRAGNIQMLPVEQYTGLTDKNGVDAYQGDIATLSHLVSSKSERLGVITASFTDGVKITAIDNGTVYGSLFIDKVIGNIHQNPELLK
jgi:uncharacterized phage protein (TIGR01671 family)